ncbi:MAG: MBL fold metallo-hydrolase [Dehalococcoidia bacterium]|nr:MBL fold metallo-hydrolase [Dehalococcoidia bacterium]
MQVQGFVVGRLAANCFVLADEESGDALVVDPGDNAAELLAQFREREFNITGILATHHHLDHSGGVHDLLEALPDAKFYMHRLDYPMIAAQAPTAGSWYGHDVTPPREPDRFLDHGDTIELGGRTLTALHCPGHTPGSLCLYGEGAVFTGDVLFAGSVGRSDFPGGDAETLIRSIREHLLTLPDETAVLPGHNQTTTVGAERAVNPFLRDPRGTLGIDLD